MVILRNWRSEEKKNDHVTGNAYLTLFSGAVMHVSKLCGKDPQLACQLICFYCGYPIGWNKAWKKGHMCTVETSLVFSKIFFLLSLPMETRPSIAHGPGLVALSVSFLLRLSVLRQNICYFSAPQPADCLYGTIQPLTM